VADIDTSGIDPKLLEDPLFQQLMEEGLAMQERLARISHEMVVQLHKILCASGLWRLRHSLCDMVRKPQPAGGQKIKEMRRQSVRSAG